MNVAGRIRKIARDRVGHYRAECKAMARELGWKESDVWYQFEQMALIRQINQRCGAALAEMLALEDVRQIFDKKGQQPS